MGRFLKGYEQFRFSFLSEREQSCGELLLGSNGILLSAMTKGCEVELDEATNHCLRAYLLLDLSGEGIGKLDGLPLFMVDDSRAVILSAHHQRQHCEIIFCSACLIAGGVELGIDCRWLV